MRGATGYLGNTMVFEESHLLWFTIADSVSFALLTVFIVPPGVHLQYEEKNFKYLADTYFSLEETIIGARNFKYLMLLADTYFLL